MPLDSLRSEIDELDGRLVELLNCRARKVAEIGRLKAESSGAAYDPAREREVYKGVAGMNGGPLPESAIRAIWCEIMSACLALERPTRVAFLGPEGTFTHQAARSKFGSSVEYLAERTIPDVFAAVAASRADYGVVPVENSTEGTVNVTVDTLAEATIRIVSEVYLPVHLALVGRGPISAVKRVYSHAQPLAQARRFLATRLPGAEAREFASTARAVEAASADPDAAAVAAELAAEGRDVEVLARNIEDAPDNETRFFVVGRESLPRTGRDKTSMVVSIVKDEVGALHSMLGTFRGEGVNLTSIHSRPSRRRAWDYMFFIDCEGHIGDENVAKAVESLESRTSHVQILGSYPAAARGGETV